MGSPKTYYTYAFKMKVLTALDANEGNITKTAAQFGIAKKTVSDWNQSRERIFEQATKYAEDRQLPLHQRLNLLINQISDALPGMVESARLGDATRALSTLITLSESLKVKQEAQEAQNVTLYEKFEKIMKRFDDPQEFGERLKRVHDEQVKLRTATGIVSEEADDYTLGNGRRVKVANGAKKHAADSV